MSCARVALRRHAQAIAERVRQLGAKSYWSQFEKSPDFVILFIPGDQFLSAALAETADPARRRDSPGRHHRDAVELRRAAEGRCLWLAADGAGAERRDDSHARPRICTSVWPCSPAHLSRLGRNLGISVDAFNSAVGSLERQVLPGARKFTELGVRPEREIESLEPIDDSRASRSCASPKASSI